MKPAATVCLTTLLGFATAAWPQPKPAADTGTATAPLLPAGTAAKITEVTGRVELFGSGIELGHMAKRDELLKLGVKLVARSQDGSVELTCANGVSFTLNDMFEVTIATAGPEERCTIDLTNGTAFGVSNPEKAGDAGKAAINGGLVKAESGHTQFGVTVAAADSGAAEAFVVEGEAIVWSQGRKDVVTGGNMYVARTKAIVAVPETRYRSLATNLARIDLQRAGANPTAAAAKSLESTYYQTLRNPADKAARQELNNQYKTYKIPESSISKYNTRQINKASKFGGGATAVPQAPTGLTAEAVAVQPVAPMAAPAVAPHYVTPMAAMVAPGHIVAAQLATFVDPMLNNQRLDYCLRWGVECGAPAADAFCRQKGYARSTSFTQAPDIGAQSPTLVLGDNRVCSTASCDGFASINCE